MCDKCNFTTGSNWFFGLHVLGEHTAEEADRITQHGMAEDEYSDRMARQNAESDTIDAPCHTTKSTVNPAAIARNVQWSSEDVKFEDREFIRPGDRIWHTPLGPSPPGNWPTSLVKSVERDARNPGEVEEHFTLVLFGSGVIFSM